MNGLGSWKVWIKWRGGGKSELRKGISEETAKVKGHLSKI